MGVYDVFDDKQNGVHCQLKQVIELIPQHAQPRNLISPGVPGDITLLADICPELREGIKLHAVPTDTFPEKQKKSSLSWNNTCYTTSVLTW